MQQYWELFSFMQELRHKAFRTKTILQNALAAIILIPCARWLTDRHIQKDVNVFTVEDVTINRLEETGLESETRNRDKDQNKKSNKSDKAQSVKSKVNKLQ